MWRSSCNYHTTTERMNEQKKLNFNRFAVDFAVQLRLYRACIFLNHHRYLKPHCAQWVRNDSTRACVRFIFFGEFLCESKYLFGTSEKNPIFVPYNPHAVQHFHLHIRSTRENVLGFFFARTNLRCSAIAYENRFYWKILRLISFCSFFPQRVACVCVYVMGLICFISLAFLSGMP